MITHTQRKATQQSDWQKTRTTFSIIKTTACKSETRCESMRMLRVFPEPIVVQRLFISKIWPSPVGETQINFAMNAYGRGGRREGGRERRRKSAGSTTFIAKSDRIVYFRAGCCHLYQQVALIRRSLSHGLSVLHYRSTTTAAAVV